jgi:hypothetical protein
MELVLRCELAILLTGCSFSSITRATPPPQSPGDCTTSERAPRLDVTGAAIGVGGMVLGAVIVGSAQRCSDQHPPGYNADSCLGEGGLGVLTFLPSAVLALAYGASAIYGYHYVGECRARLFPAVPTIAAPAVAGTVPVLWFCAESTLGSVGVCKPDRGQCEEYRSRSKHELSDCTARTTAVCFDLGTEPHCAPTREICDALHAAAEQSGGTVSACEQRHSAGEVP